MKTVAIVQARMGSTRLPGKVMLDVGGQPLIALLLQRLARAETISEIVVATTVDAADDRLADYVSGLGHRVYRGSRTDVLGRYLGAAQEAGADIVLRITGDCPLIDPDVVDNVVRSFLAAGVDYASNVSPPSFPDGLDTEVFSFAALADSASRADTAFQREHVTPHLRDSGLYSAVNFANDIDLSSQRWTVDEAADLDVIRSVVAHFAPDTTFNFRDVAALAQKNPELFETNQSIPRNQGAKMGTGQKLWQRAKRVIPGGNMLLSKRAEMFLPEKWPAYFSKAKGCKVWDLDGNEYTDMTIMGIGTNTLGYGHPEVDAAVQQVVLDGNMSTLNCPEEVYLAEKLIELHPWADMVRFARSGGEANAIAIRIARAASGRDKVAVCGYHGWHDWYLAANLAHDKNLDGHLLPGLEPKGVPRELQGSVIPFSYNNFEQLLSIVEQNDIGVIKMEVVRSTEPKDNFLQNVRDLATERNIVLIFDECTSGFRQTFGGLHKLYGVEPDMAMFGKALGNGYAITATIGRREVMEAAQSTFISSTFWTERIGPAAGLKTLEVMEKTQSWDKITSIGLDIRAKWQLLADKHGLEIEHWGLPALTGYSFKSPAALAYKTYITQEMLKLGYLVGNSVYVCTEHSPEVIESFFSALDPLFGAVKECENGRDIMALLEGPVAHSGFKRLN